MGGWGGHIKSNPEYGLTTLDKSKNNGKRQHNEVRDNASSRL